MTCVQYSTFVTRILCIIFSTWSLHLTNILDEHVCVYMHRGLTSYFQNMKQTRVGSFQAVSNEYIRVVNAHHGTGEPAP
uniref:Putative secreted protein n=1 Tax=Rhipicephalus microplus TaxID=6941 RepID=A0A6G5A2V0_RHIMP